MKTALILAGSGARGIIQAGMIKAFCDMGLKYDMLYGSSAGALNGALLHAGQVDIMLGLWHVVRNKSVYTSTPWNMFAKNKGCLYDSQPLLKLLNNVVDVPKLQSNKKPFWINVTNVNTWTPFRVSHLSGNVIDYLWSSACPPVLFPPNKDPIFGNWLTDGGVTNNYSISDAVNDGAERLIIFAPMIPEPKPIKSIIDAIDITISAGLYNQLIRELKFVEKLNTVPGFRQIRVDLVTLKEPCGIGIFDFDQTQQNRDKFLALGYNLAIEKLDTRKAVAV